MISFKTLLDTRRAKKDGTYPIVIRMYLERQWNQIPTGHSVSENEWDENKGEINRTCKRYKSLQRVNISIQRRKLDLYDRAISFIDENSECDIQEIKDFLTGKDRRKLNLFEFHQLLIDRMICRGQLGNARIYREVLVDLKKFRNGRDIALNKVDYRFLVKYENYSLSRGMSVNGLGIKLRTLRAVLNHAIREKLLSRDKYPFELYKIKKAETRKRAISEETLKRIIDLEFEKGTRQYMARSYFLISFHLIGMNFTDMARLKVANINNSRIEYRRSKTKKLFSIKISDALWQLLDEYVGSKHESDYILPVIHSPGTLEEEYLQVKNGLRLFNYGLKDIGKMVGMTTVLSTYVSRHTWATIAKKKMVPISVISEGLGHSSTEVTSTYLDSFDKSIIDEYNVVVTTI